MSAKQERPASHEQYCSVECACGEKIGTYFAHYDIARCLCGRSWWALQPKRNGPFKLYLWPGDWRMKAAKESAQQYETVHE